MTDAVPRVPPGDRVLITMYAWLLVDGTSTVDFGGEVGIQELSAKGIAEARQLIASSKEAAAFFEQIRRDAIADARAKRSPAKCGRT